MRNCLVPGVSHSLSLQVNDPALVTAFTPHLSALADLPPVFATAFMVGFMEWSCIDTLQPYLLDGENTVGTHVYLNHVARTPVGMRVTARVELMEMKDRVLRFRVDCYDDCGLIGSGYHERTAVDRFMDKVRRKGTALLAAA
jgi:fluoroacetyl-CoA thioesterase